MKQENSQDTRENENLADPLKPLPVEDVTFEIQIKTEKPDTEESQVDINDSICEGDRVQRYLCKIEPVGNNCDRVKTRNSPKKNKKKRICKAYVKRKAVRKKRRKIINYTHSSDEEFLPTVNDAAFNAFLNKNDGKLVYLKYKNVELRRELNTKGYSLDAEELEVFLKDGGKDGGKLQYICDDCSFASESKDVFTVHFLMHANMYFIIETINKTSGSHYCYICDKECLNGALLLEHLENHKQNDESNKDNAATGNQRDVVLKVESIKVKNDEEEMDDEPLQEHHYLADNDSYHSELELEKDNIKDVKEKVLEGVIKFEPQKPLAESDVNMDAVKNESHYEDFPKVKEEFIVPIENIKEEIMFVKCEECKFETPIGQPDRHKCKEVRQCDMCEKMFLNKWKLRYHVELHFCGICPFESSSIDAVLEHRKTSVSCCYKCADCNFTSTSNASFRRHVRTKTCKKHSCDICQEGFQTVRAFRHHRLKHFCHKCQFKSSSLDEVSEHIQDNKECWYECHNCKFQTESSALLQKHKKSCFENRAKREFLREQLTCNVCGYKTNYKDNMEKHFILCNTSSKASSFICEICGRACRDSRLLKVHHKSHYCEMCSFMSVSRNEVLYHKSNSPDCKYKCNSCDFQTIHFNSMTAHQKKGCSRKSSTFVKKRDDKDLLNCPLCSYKTHSRVYLDGHVKKHSDPKPFHCDQCDFKCALRGNLRIHMKKHIQGKNYRCTLCNYECSHLSMFRNHKKTHGLDESVDIGEKDRDPRYFYCDRCEYRSKHMQYLKSHVMKHDNIRPFLCSLCGKTFTSSTECNSHKHIAHKENVKKKIYKCSYCNYTGDKGTVKVHERKHTGSKPYSCEFCSYSTSYSGNLSHHRKMHLEKIAPHAAQHFNP